MDGRGGTPLPSESRHQSRRARRRASEGVGVRTIISKSAANKPSTSTDHDAHRRGIGAASFRECPLRLARSAEQRDQTVVPFMTARLIVDAVRGIALLLQLLPDGP